MNPKAPEFSVTLTIKKKEPVKTFVKYGTPFEFDDKTGLYIPRGK